MSRFALRAIPAVPSRVPLAAIPARVALAARVAHLARVAVTGLAALACLAASPARAQDYGFELPAVLLETWVEPDGTLTLDYTFEIRNAPDARALDGVDVGMPGRDWSLQRVRAWIGDREITDVIRSPYVDDGVAANLPDGGLAPGASAVVRVRAEGVGGLLFADTTAEDRVSLRLTPTWFDGRYVRGTTRVRVVVHLPPGVPVEALTWHAVPWTGQVMVETTSDREEHAAVVWDDERRFTGPWELGVSFPHHVTDAAGNTHATVAGVRSITTWDLFESWAGQPRTRTWSTVLFLAAFTLIFFWATRRTGCVPWALLAAGLFVAFAIRPVLPFLLAPLLPLLAWAVRAARLRRRRAYVPAVASVEGGGIKRGLTSPEAACLLEAPAEKILLLVLYGLSRKGFATLEAKGEKGLMARAEAGFGLGAPADVKQAADKGSVLHPYESAFLSLLKGSVLLDVASVNWRPALRGVAEHAASRLAGYDIEQTRDYYRRIVARAWKEAATLGDVELRKEAVDRTFDWLVLDDDAFRRMDSWHRAGWRYWNPWIPSTRPVGAALPGMSGPPALPGAPPLPGPVKASDVAGSIGSRMEGLAGGVASAIGLGSGPGVFSKVDKVSGDAFKSILTEMAKSSSGRSGGGGGFSCACACAGCACACACAGGGR